LRNFGKILQSLDLDTPHTPTALEFTEDFKYSDYLKFLEEQKDQFRYMSTCHFVEVPVTFVDAMLYLHQKRVNLVDMWSI